MKKVIIIWSCGLSHIATKALVKHNMGVVVVSSPPVFEPEPLVFKKYEFQYEKPVFYENEPSKFMSKPKNNFKKR